MQQFIIIFLSALSLISFTGHSQGYRIATDIKGQTDTVAYLGHHFATQRYVDDTATVVNGRAVFTGSKPLTEGIYFYYSPSLYFEFLIEDQQFSISGEAPDVVATATISGSPVNEGFYKMQRFMATKQQEAEAIRNGLDSTATFEERQAATEKLKALDDEIKAFRQQLQQEYPGTLLDRLLRLWQTPQIPPVPAGMDSLQFSYQYYKKHFWDGIDITDPGLLRSPILHGKIMDYLDNVVVQHPDSVIAAVDELLAKAQNSQEAFRYLLITLTNKYEASPVVGLDKVFVHLVDKYYLTGQAPWSSEETLKKLANRAASIRPNFIGNPAPNITWQDTLGTDVRLSDIKARYTVLYFYDPDCGHCKKATPILYNAYPELKEKGVEVLAICTATNDKRWRQYIRENDLQWINLADMANRTNFRFYYDIRSTPTVYILDEDKTILLKKIAVQDIPEVIDQLIALEKED